MDTVTVQGLAGRQGSQLHGARGNLILASTVTDKEEVIGCYKRDCPSLCMAFRNSYVTVETSGRLGIDVHTLHS